MLLNPCVNLKLLLFRTYGSDANLLVTKIHLKGLTLPNRIYLFSMCMNQDPFFNSTKENNNLFKYMHHA